MHIYKAPGKEQRGLFPAKLNWKILGKITGWQVLSHRSTRTTHYIQSGGHVSLYISLSLKPGNKFMNKKAAAIQTTVATVKGEGCEGTVSERK